MEFDYTADQAKQRRWSQVEDQFGRMWGTYVEKSTGDPCCEISPFGGWNDPLHTPNSYLRVPRHEDGSPMHGKIKVDFERWIDRTREAEDDWKRTIAEAGKATYKITTKAERAEWEDDPVLQEIAGPRPTPTLETLTKAMNGDRDLLGLNAIPRKKTANPLDMTYQEFVAENRRDEFGNVRTMAECGALWKEHLKFKEGAEVPEEVEV